MSHLSEQISDRHKLFFQEQNKEPVKTAVVSKDDVLKETPEKDVKQEQGEKKEK